MSKRQQDGAINVFLGSESSIEGTLRFTGQARLDGSFKGQIEGDGFLLIGPAARIEGDIFATDVVISGEVTGQVVASRRLEMKAPGKLVGDISAPLVVMDEGVSFEGHCTMASPGQPAPRELGGKVTLLAAHD